MTRTSFLRTGLTALAALVLLTVSSPVAQAQTLRGADFKCMHDVDPGVTATATLTWYQPDGTVAGGPYTFICTQGTTASQDVVQPLGADNWKVEVTLAGGACSSCYEFATGAFVADTFPRIRERFTSFSYTTTFVLQRR